MAPLRVGAPPIIELVDDWQVFEAKPCLPPRQIDRCAMLGSPA